VPAWSSTSVSVRSTACSTRAIERGARGIGSTSVSVSGAGGSGVGVSGGSPQVPRTPCRSRNRVTAFSVQDDESDPSVECPVAGIVSSVDCGSWAATRCAPSSGVRRSCSPSRISAGTSGSGG
jgi:hypothetical protein